MDLQEFHQKLIRMISKEAAQQMQPLGVALAAQLPTNLCCCNPACTNVHMPSEVQLVGGKACVCSGCKAARFCSRACLQQCWTREQHKPVCKRIAAAQQQQQQLQQQQQQQQLQQQQQQQQETSMAQ
jgi:hypothetical protein